MEVKYGMKGKLKAVKLYQYHGYLSIMGAYISCSYEQKGLNGWGEKFNSHAIGIKRKH